MSNNLTSSTSVFFSAKPQMLKDSPSKEEEDGFETPTMSFESFLTYDAPISVKKKKKNPASSSSSSSHSLPAHSASSYHAPTLPSSSSSSKVSKVNGTQSIKRPHSGSSSASAIPEKRKRVRSVAACLESIRMHLEGKQ